jgi:hypothetical protein
MQSKILYVPQGITLDLSEPDFGYPDGREIIERHYQEGRRRHPEHDRSNPAFACIVHLGNTNPGLFLKKIDGNWWAAHYEAGPCPSYRIPAPMSDEHKRQAEYWARAAEDSGWRVEMERTLRTGTRPDVLIHGSMATGVEVQRSPMTAAGAVDRTCKAAAAGVSDLWFTANRKPPLWAWRVPTVLNRELGIAGEGHAWDTLPARRTVTAAGLRTIRAARCLPMNFSRCPYGRPRHCDKVHPRTHVWRDMTVDDVAAQFPAGEIVALRFWGTRELGSRRRDAMLLVSSADAAFYTELTGQPAEALVLRPSSRNGPSPRKANGSVECRNPQTALDSDDEDPYGLGTWEACTGCRRRYRPAHPSGRCHDCRYPGDP